MQPPDQARVGPARPRVLFVYYTYTQQTRKVVDAMAKAFRERGCDVHEAPIDFIGLAVCEALPRVSASPCLP